MNRSSLLLARVIVAGTILSAVLMAAGLVWYLVAHPEIRPGDHIFSGEPKYFRDPVSMVQRAFEPDAVGHRRSVAMIGVLVLLAGPLIRVALAGAGYLIERDRLYAVISAVVLLILTMSFFW
ncbi:MAG: DUF1634 domain-containing protein [Terrimicrobiaceae bacterium]|nr:DUF1634 domain-containing protein [Terrimicrobiaceae bacterium]